MVSQDGGCGGNGGEKYLAYMRLLIENKSVMWELWRMEAKRKSLGCAHAREKLPARKNEHTDVVADAYGPLAHAGLRIVQT